MTNRNKANADAAKADAEWDKARADWTKATADWERANARAPKDEILAYILEKIPDCAWNGKELRF